MRNLTLTTTLSALLVSLPLVGASAQSHRGVPDGAPVAVDTFATSSIGAAAGDFSHARQLDRPSPYLSPEGPRRNQPSF